MTDRQQTTIIMTKHTTEQDKIEAWMKKKNEWAKQMISAYPEGTTFNTIVEKSRQMQSNVTRVQRKLKTIKKHFRPIMNT